MLLLSSSSPSKDDKVHSDGEGESNVSTPPSLIVTDLPEGFVIGDTALGVVALELVMVTRCILVVAPERVGAAIGRYISSFAVTVTGFFGW